MRKDKRTKKERQADARRAEKKLARNRSKSKTRHMKLEMKRRKEANKEKAFREHMKRLRGDMV